MTDGGDTIGELGARLIDDGKAYAKAEIEVVKATALVYARAAKTAAIFAVAALVLVLAALPVLIAGIGVALARWLGPAGGLLVAAGGVIVLALLLALVAYRAVSRIGGALA